MLDYAAWLKRALAFLERLGSFPGKVGIEKEVAPPFTQADVEAFARACKIPLPEPLRRFWATASRHCRCTYWWETPDAFHRQLGVAFPEKSLSTLNGGPEFAAPEYLLSFVNTTTTDWGADGNNRITFPRDTRYWEGSFPLIPAGNGDYVGLYFRENPENPPVVYLCHESYGGSGIIARNFDEFLGVWERLGYIGVDLLHSFANRETGLLDPSAQPVQLEALDSLLRAVPRPDLAAAPLTFTEEEWLSSRDPTSLLTWLEREGKLDERKLRLFGCACCRRIWNRFTEAAQKAVEVAERYADGQATASELEEAAQPLRGQPSRLFTNVTRDDVRQVVRLLKHPEQAMEDPWFQEQVQLAQDEGAELHRLSNIHGLMRQAVLTVVDRRFMSRLITWEITQHLDEPEYSIELAAHADLVRHIFDYPLRTILTPMPSEVTQLAQRLYGGENCVAEVHRALAAAGHKELAEHFLRPDHPKGCWALDAILSA